MDTKVSDPMALLTLYTLCLRSHFHTIWASLLFCSSDNVVDALTSFTFFMAAEVVMHC